TPSPLTALSPRPTLFPYTTLFRSHRNAPTPAPTPAQAQRPYPWPASLRSATLILCSSTLAKPVHAPSAVCQAIAERFCYIEILRSEEHTSELQSRENLVCRLLLEK